MYIHSVVIRLACIRQVARVPGEPRSNSNCNINNILKYTVGTYGIAKLEEVGILRIDFICLSIMVRNAPTEGTPSFH